MQRIESQHSEISFKIIYIRPLRFFANWNFVFIKITTNSLLSKLIFCTAANLKFPFQDSSKDQNFVMGRAEWEEKMKKNIKRCDVTSTWKMILSIKEQHCLKQVYWKKGEKQKERLLQTSVYINGKYLNFLRNKNRRKLSLSTSKRYERSISRNTYIFLKVHQYGYSWNASFMKNGNNKL